MSKLKTLWLTLDSSFWFVPTLMVLAAYGLVHLDVALNSAWTARYPLLFEAGADGARGTLLAIADSMITVAGLIFSLTLAQVASQYASRRLRNFTIQVVMGSFVSVFVYCLVVLRTIRGGDEGGFVPSLASSFGLLLALVSIGMLIFFIHHIASSIQAANIVAAETAKLLDKVFPERLGEAAERAVLRQQADLTLATAKANLTGPYELDQVQARYQQLLAAL